MPPSPTPPVQQDFLNTLTLLPLEERTMLIQFMAALINSPGHRRTKIKLAHQMVDKISAKPAWWSMLDVTRGKTRMTINMVNGNIETMEVTDHG